MRPPGFGAPGVFVRRRDLEAPSALPSAIAGMVGLAERGPCDRPQMLRGWGDYLSVFGEPVSYGSLAETVYTFFANGGEECHVVRVADPRDRTAENPATGCRRVELLKRARADALKDYLAADSLSVEAIDPGRWGNEIQVGIEPGSLPHLELTTLTVPAAAGATTITVATVGDLQPTETIRLRNPGAPFTHETALVDAINVGTKVLTLHDPLVKAFPSGAAVDGRGFRLTARWRNREEAFDDLSIAPEHPRFVERVVNGDRHQHQYLARARDGHSILVTVRATAGAAAPRPAPLTILKGGGDGADVARATLKDAASAEAGELYARAGGSAGNGIIARATPFETRLALPAAAGATSIVVESAVAFRAGDSVTIEAPVTPPSETRVLAVNSDPNTNTIALPAALASPYPIGSRVFVDTHFTLEIDAGGVAPRVYPNLTAPGFAAVINADPDSPVCAQSPTTVEPPSGTFPLTQGQDPGTFPVQYYLGYRPDGSPVVETRHSDSSTPALEPEPPHFGLATLELVEAVSLVATPDLWRAASAAPTKTGAVLNDEEFIAAQRLVLFHCRELGDRFALLDPPNPDTRVDEIKLWPARIGDRVLSRFGALYFPWIDVMVPPSVRRMPPCGLVAGAAAISDHLGGVNRAPANVWLKGVVDFSLRVDAETQDELNPLGVNCVRKLTDDVLSVWGARTLSPEPQHRYVNIRRALLVVIKGLRRQLAWTVFEPNDPTLWARIESTLRGFLTAVLVRGVTAGDTAAEAFFVRCDVTTNPPESVALGQVQAEIGIALAAPAEFIVLTVRRTPDSLMILETDG